MENTLFSDERLSDVMMTYLNNIIVMKTKIGVRDNKGYIYTGIEDVGGPYGVGSILRKDDGSLNVKINTIFNERAQKAMDTLRGDDSYTDVLRIFDDIQSHHLLIYPINLNKKVETWLYDKRLPIIKSKAVYDNNTGRCPLYYYVQEKPNSESIVLPLKSYIRSWGLDGMVVTSEPGYKDEIVEFSDANYMNTIVIKSKKNVLVVDSIGVYYGTNDDDIQLIGETSELINILYFNGISKEIRNYLTPMRLKLISQHRRWIVPYKCGDENVIKL